MNDKNLRTLFKVVILFAIFVLIICYRQWILLIPMIVLGIWALKDEICNLLEIWESRHDS